MTHPNRIVVFSDADSLLPSQLDSAVVREAATVLHALECEQVPVVLCSSRTRAEVQHVQAALGMRHPFVCEHGGAAFIPAGYFGFDVPGARGLPGAHVLEFGPPYVEVVRALHETSAQLGVEVVGFSDMSVDEVARAFDMPLLQARLATLREYGECFQVQHDPGQRRARLFKRLAAQGLRCTPGRHFDHVGAPVRTSAGVRRLCSLFAHAGPVTTLGLVDRRSDQSLLPIVSHRILACEDGVDLAGWAEAIVDGVDQLRRDTGRDRPRPPMH